MTTILGKHVRRGRRPHLEDHVYVSSMVTGIFDGHGGDATAANVTPRASRAVKECLREAGRIDATDAELKTSIRRAFEAIQRSLRRSPTYAMCGTTCNVVGRLFGDRLCIVNMGDSRAVVINEQNGRLVYASKDHTASSHTEHGRIHRRSDSSTVEGNRLVQGDIGLIPTRGFGNTSVTAFISCPSIKIVKNIPRRCIVIQATDGFWDVCSSDEAFSVYQQFKNSTNPARDMTRWAVNDRKSGDNVSVIVSLVSRD